jgi:hypothetical protein
MERTFKTTLIWHDGVGSECEAEASVTYVGRKGFAGDRTDPPEPASVEIIKIVSAIYPEDAIPDRLREDDALIDECFEHWADDEAAGEEYRADQRAEMLREES